MTAILASPFVLGAAGFLSAAALFFLGLAAGFALAPSIQYLRRGHAAGSCSESPNSSAARQRQELTPEQKRQLRESAEAMQALHAYSAADAYGIQRTREEAETDE